MTIDSARSRKLKLSLIYPPGVLGHCPRESFGNRRNLTQLSATTIESEQLPYYDWLIYGFQWAPTDSWVILLKAMRHTRKLTDAHLRASCAIVRALEAKTIG